MGKINAYLNWSGGKDSSLALYKIREEDQYQVRYLLTSVNKIHDRISMHGVRTELLRQQASSIDIPLKLVKLPEEPDMTEYEKAMENQLNEISNKGIRHAIFGDIFLEDLKQYRQSRLEPLGMECVFPLWKISTKELMEEFLELGFKAIVVCVNEEFLDKSFCGALIDRAFINDLPRNVDICGENGEYHSFVFDGPIFKTPIPFKKGEIVYREYAKPKDANNGPHHSSQKEQANYGFYFCDLLPTAFSNSLEKK